MNSEKMGMKQPSVYLTVETPLPQYLPYARFLRSRSSITRAFTELESSGLLERLHSGFSKPSRILLKVPQNVQGYSSMLCTGASSDGAKVTNVDVQNCIPNHLNRNQQKYNNKQKQKNMPGLPEYMFEEGESL